MGSEVTAATARTLWTHVETINAVTYFTAECRDAPAELGLRGFWMGYFGQRAAPLGPVPAGVVEATFYNFHPDRVRRAIPDAWTYATPDALLTARATAAAAALRRILGADVAERLAAAVIPALCRLIDAADGAGRPLFAANREVSPPDDPVAALWQAATTVREHRGDGHVALLTGAGLDGCEVHVVQADGKSIEPELFRASRGWSADDWRAATERLAGRGLVTIDGTLTDRGRALRAEIERRTDELAAQALVVRPAADVEHLLAVLDPASRTVATSGEVTYPNPMGLPSTAPTTA